MTKKLKKIIIIKKLKKIIIIKKLKRTIRKIIKKKKFKK